MTPRLAGLALLLLLLMALVGVGVARHSFQHPGPAVRQYNPCINNWTPIYMNRKDVLKVGFGDGPRAMRSGTGVARATLPAPSRYPCLLLPLLFFFFRSLFHSLSLSLSLSPLSVCPPVNPQALHVDSHYTRTWPQHPSNWEYGSELADIALLFPKVCPLTDGSTVGD